MSKRSWYFAVLVIMAVTVFAAAFFNFSSITANVISIKSMVLDLRVIIPAIVCAFVFTKYNPYWMVMCLCALVVSVSLQAYYGSQRFGGDMIFLRAIAFLVVVYVIDYARVIIARK